MSATFPCMPLRATPSHLPINVPGQATQQLPTPDNSPSVTTQGSVLPTPLRQRRLGASTLEPLSVASRKQDAFFQSACKTVSSGSSGLSTPPGAFAKQVSIDPSSPASCVCSSSPTRPPTCSEEHPGWYAVVGEGGAQPAGEIGATPFIGYDVQRHLGQGAICNVYLASRRLDGELVALKVTRDDDPEAHQAAEREFKLLRAFRHPNIIMAHDYWVSEQRAVISLEYFESNTLDEAVRSNSPTCLSEPQARRLTRQLVKAVDHMHQKRVVHRDIKPSNLLVSLELKCLKLADFNAATEVGTLWALSPTGTKSFAAPEVIAGEPPAERNDTWSVGLCLYFMLVGAYPQRRDRCRSMTSLVAETKKPILFSGSCFDAVSPAGKEFLGRCLRIEVGHRPAPMTLLQDEWLRQKLEREPYLVSHTVPELPRPLYLLESEDVNSSDMSRSWILEEMEIRRGACGRASAIARACRKRSKSCSTFSSKDSGNLSSKIA